MNMITCSSDQVLIKIDFSRESWRNIITKPLEQDLLKDQVYMFFSNPNKKQFLINQM